MMVQRGPRGYRGLLLAGCVALAATMAVLAGSAFGQSAKRGTLTMTATADITLDPPNAPGETDLTVLHNVYQTLVGYDFAKSKVVPELAQRWKLNADGSVYRFFLNPKAKFASGNPVTADDVKYSFDRVVAFPTSAQGFQVAPYLTANSVKVINPLTVEITIKTASPAFLAALTGTAASILDSKVVKSHESGGDQARPWLASNTAGSGPFVVTDWVKDSHITLTRNAKYWGPRPQLQSVVIQYVSSEPQAVSLLRGGDIDAATSVLPSDVKSLKKAGYNVVTGQGLFTYYLSMNELPGAPFAKTEVRQAVRYALDYNGLINKVLGGEAVRAGGVVGKGLLGYQANLNNQYKTNLAKAKSLLAKAGYPSGFKTELYYQSDAPVLGVSADTLAAKIQSDLARVGIDITLKGEPSATVFPQYRSGQLPFVFWYFGPTYPDPDVIMSPHGDWNTQATTRVHFNDPTVTDLIVKARTTVKPSERAKLYAKAQQLVAANGPYAFLFRPLAVTVVRKGVTFPWIPIWTVDLSKASAS
jgi:peptide/nickel transport system substrate-binding protein